jgi:inorganic pyrophosphatase
LSPHSLSDDCDPLDVMVVGNRALVPGAVLRARPVGVLMMEDEKGVDEKIIAVPHQALTAYYNNITTYKDLPDILVQRIVHFFEHYKDLEPNKWVKVQGCYGLDRAEDIILACIEKAGKAKG